MTFREIEQFVLDGRLVLSVVDNVRLQRFLHKNTTKKLIFLCLIFTDVNASQEEINVPFCLKKNPSLRVVRIGLSCFYNFFTVLGKLVFSGYHLQLN